MTDRSGLQAFEAASPMLMGLAYRILGSRADAEDAVQDTFLKWQAADKGAIDNPASWLTAVCTRRCIDLLRAAHRTRVDYVGPWLPEPIQAAAGEGENPEEALALTSSLSTAFLLLLERLTPKERAAYLLHEIFDVPYPEIARTLGIEESTCRKLVSRARANVDRAKVRHATPVDRQEQLLAAFQGALATGATDALAVLLSDDITLTADGGNRVPAIRRPLAGKAEVLAFISGPLSQFWSTYELIPLDLNGARGLLLKQDGKVVGATSFAYDESGRASGIYIVRNPDKLAGLDATA